MKRKLFSAVVFFSLFLFSMSNVFANDDSITCLYYNENFNGYQYIEFTIDTFQHKTQNYGNEKVWGSLKYGIKDMSFKKGTTNNLLVEKYEYTTYNYLAYVYPDLDTCPDTIYVDQYKTKNGSVTQIFGSRDHVAVNANGYFYVTVPNDEDLYQFDYVNADKVSCGSGQGMVTGIPKKIPELTSSIFTIIQIAIPIILVIMGSLDLFKGITAGKEDEMKKGQQMFIKRLVVAALIFFVVVIVKFLISIIADTNVSNVVDCVDCFVSNDCSYDFE